MSMQRSAHAPGRSATFPTSTNPWHTVADNFPVDGTAAEQLWFATQYAVLAPSTHNTQPWRFLIRGRELDLYADLARALPVADPQRRELIMSCGAALYFLRLALRYFGYEPGVELLPEIGRPDWLARVDLGTRAEIDGETIVLFQAIARRSTNRQPFREDPVPPTLLSDLETAVQSLGAWLQVFLDDAPRADVAALVAEADRRQWADRHFRKELADWVRPEHSQARDGLSIATQDLGSFLSHAGPLAIRTFDLGKGHAAKDHEIALHSPVLAVLGTPTDDPAAWLAAGQALARVLLGAQTEDVCASFLNQPIEVPELRTRLSELVARDGCPQILLRLGYAQPVPHTPRRSVHDVVQFD